MKAAAKIGSFSLLLAVAAAGHAQATELFATSLEGQQIVKVDTTANTVTQVNVSAIPQPDSLFFLNSTTLLFSGISNGTLNSLDITTGINTVLATGFSGPRDVVINPAGTTAYVSDFNNGRIATVNLSTNTVSTLLSGHNTDGLTFDDSGKFYAVLDRNTVAQINPVTGAIIASISPGGSGNLDGLTYDAFNGKLWAGDFNGGVVELPTDLSTFTNHTLGGFCGQDGVEPDGAGNLFFASRCDSRIHLVSETTFADTPLTFVSGLDDIAPVVGQGSQTGVPEPASMAGLLAGLFGLAALRRRHR